MKYIGIILLGIFLNVGLCSGQKLSVSTNMLGYLNFGTMNIEMSYAVAQHWSVNTGVKYNPWTFNRSSASGQFQIRQQSYDVGIRYWMWHTASGWWMGGKLRYQEYNMGGLISRKTEEGDRFGMAASVGYTYMLHPKVNIEFGLGIWGGFKKYSRYSCPSCGLTVERGKKMFVMPDDLIVAICYVF